MKHKDLRDLSREHKLQLIVRLWNLTIAQRKFEDDISDGLDKFVNKHFEDSRITFPRRAPSCMMQKWGDELLVSPGYEGKNNEWFSWFLEQHKNGKMSKEPHSMWVDGVEYKPKTILELAKIIL